MNLLETLDDLLQGWRPAFAQMRTFTRARRLTFGLLVCMRRHLTSQAIDRFEIRVPGRGGRALIRGNSAVSVTEIEDRIDRTGDAGNLDPPFRCPGGGGGR